MIEAVNHGETRERHLARIKERVAYVKNRLNYMDGTKSRMFNYQRKIIEFNGLRFKSCEEFERYLLNEGFNPNLIDIRSEIIPQGGGNADLVFKVGLI
jgi:hypothetical protein